MIWCISDFLLGVKSSIWFRWSIQKEGIWSSGSVTELRQRSHQCLETYLWCLTKRSVLNFFNIKNKLSEIISEMSERERGKCLEFFLIPAVIKTLSLNTFSQILIWWVTCSCNIHSSILLPSTFQNDMQCTNDYFLMNSSTSFDRVPKDIWPSWCVYNWKRRIVLPRIDERCGQVTRRERSV